MALAPTVVKVPEVELLLEECPSVVEAPADSNLLPRPPDMPTCSETETPTVALAPIVVEEPEVELLLEECPSVVVVPCALASSWLRVAALLVSWLKLWPFSLVVELPSVVDWVTEVPCVVSCVALLS